MANSSHSNSTQITPKQPLKERFVLPGLLSKASIMQLKGFKTAKALRTLLTDGFYIRVFGMENLRIMKYRKCFYNDEVELLITALNLSDLEIDNLLKIQFNVE